MPMNRSFVSFAGLVLARKAPGLALLLLRLLAGGLMLTHGCAKIAGFAQLSATFPDPIGWGSTASLVMITLVETVCSLLVILGLFTRLALLPLLFSMWIAAFCTYPAFALETSELALLYFGMFVVLLIGGSGRLSLDMLLWRRLERWERRDR